MVTEDAQGNEEEGPIQGRGREDEEDGTTEWMSNEQPQRRMLSDNGSRGWNTWVFCSPAPPIEYDMHEEVTAARTGERERRSHHIVPTP